VSTGDALTTIIAPVPTAEEVVAAVRLGHDWPARVGVPAHVTLLGPFLPPEAVTEGVLDGLRAIFTQQTPIRFAFAGLRRVGSIAYLAPAPHAELHLLTSALEDAFPEAPRYGEQFGGRLYHLTVARECDDTLFAELQALLSAALPIRASIEEAVLVERSAAGDVKPLDRFPFGRAPGRGDGMHRRHMTSPTLPPDRNRASGPGAVHDATQGAGVSGSGGCRDDPAGSARVGSAAAGSGSTPNGFSALATGTSSRLSTRTP
jgi:hypothetical protein